MFYVVLYYTQFDMEYKNTYQYVIYGAICMIKYVQFYHLILYLN